MGIDAAASHSGFPSQTSSNSDVTDRRDGRARRHAWNDPVRFMREDRPDIGKSERTCKNGCGIVKVTVHPGGTERAWQEFWRDGEKIDCVGTPPCEGAADSSP